MWRLWIQGPRERETNSSSTLTALEDNEYFHLHLNGLGHEAFGYEVDSSVSWPLGRIQPKQGFSGREETLISLASCWCFHFLLPNITCRTWWPLNNSWVRSLRPVEGRGKWKVDLEEQRETFSRQSRMCVMLVPKWAQYPWRRKKNLCSLIHVTVYKASKIWWSLTWQLCHCSFNTTQETGQIPRHYKFYSSWVLIFSCWKNKIFYNTLLLSWILLYLGYRHGENF
jgi:hypothetical protein